MHNIVYTIYISKFVCIMYVCLACGVQYIESVTRAERSYSSCCRVFLQQLVSGLESFSRSQLNRIQLRDLHLNCDGPTIVFDQEYRVEDFKIISSLHIAIAEIEHSSNCMKSAKQLLSVTLLVLLVEVINVYVNICVGVVWCVYVYLICVVMHNVHIHFVVR